MGDPVNPDNHLKLQTQEMLAKKLSSIRAGINDSLHMMDRDLKDEMKIFVQRASTIKNMPDDEKGELSNTAKILKGKGAVKVALDAYKKCVDAAIKSCDKREAGITPAEYNSLIDKLKPFREEVFRLCGDDADTSKKINETLKTKPVNLMEEAIISLNKDIKEISIHIDDHVKALGKGTGTAVTSERAAHNTLKSLLTDYQTKLAAISKIMSGEMGQDAGSRYAAAIKELKVVERYINQACDDPGMSEAIKKMVSYPIATSQLLHAMSPHHAADKIASNPARLFSTGVKEQPRSDKPESPDISPRNKG